MNFSDLYYEFNCLPVGKDNIASLLTRSFSKTIGKPVHCYYCPNCTTHVYHHQTVAGPKVVVRTILLDGAKSWKPAAEIYGKAKLAWEPEVAQTFELLPPGM